MKYFLSVIGMVLIIEGIPYFMFPAKFKVMMRLIQEMEDAQLRFVGFVVIIFGLLLLFLGKR